MYQLIKSLNSYVIATAYTDSVNLSVTDCNPKKSMHVVKCVKRGFYIKSDM